MTRLTRPPALRQGDLLAIVSPASDSAGMFPQRAERARAQLGDMGFRTLFMPYSRESGPFGSTSVQKRVADLHEAFLDPDISGVLCAIGGYGSAHLLGELDYDLIRSHPKVFCGYSDITALHTAIRQNAGLVTFYAPSVLNEFGDNGGVFRETAQSFLDSTTHGVVGEVAPFDRVVTETADWNGDAPRRAGEAVTPITVRAGAAVGPIVGGCLPVLTQLLGTPWQLRADGCILALETPQAPYPLARALSDLWHLRNSGLFADISGLAVGIPVDPGDLPGLGRAVQDVTAGFTFPVTVGLPFGHTSPMTTLPLGVKASLSTGRLWIDDPGVLRQGDER